MQLLLDRLHHHPLHLRALQRRSLSAHQLIVDNLAWYEVQPAFHYRLRTTMSCTTPVGGGTAARPRPRRRTRRQTHRRPAAPAARGCRRSTSPSPRRARPVACPHARRAPRRQTLRDGRRRRRGCRPRRRRAAAHRRMGPERAWSAARHCRPTCSTRSPLVAAASQRCARGATKRGQQRTGRRVVESKCGMGIASDHQAARQTVLCLPLWVFRISNMAQICCLPRVLVL